MTFLEHLFGGSVQIGSPLQGRAVSLSDVPDSAFSEGLLGPGVAIWPSDGKVFAPFDGIVDAVFDTKHGITLTGPAGAELLIHIGLQTVTLKGAHFCMHTTAGQSVRKGQLLMEADLEAIRATGLNPITPIILCNSGDFSRCVPFYERDVMPGDKILELRK